MIKPSNVQTPTKSSYVFRDSVASGVIGFVVGMGVIVVFTYSSLAQLVGTFLDVRLVVVFCALGTLVGWLVYLVPLSMAYRRKGWADRLIIVLPVAIAVAFALGSILTYPLRWYSGRVLTMRELYVFAGICDGSSASVCLRRLCTSSASTA